MGAIEDVYADLDAEVSEDEFREAVEAKVEQMGGLADEETAAMLVAHELDDGEVDAVSEIEADMDEVKFLAKVLDVGDLRTFERDGEDEDGRVINVTVADETDSVRLAFWDEQAAAVDDGQLETGDVLRIKGRPKEGYNGLEVSVDQAEADEEAEIDVDVGGEQTIENLSLGASDVTVTGEVLATEPVRTFDRDDGSEGRVANVAIGDETGRVRVTLWDDRADLTDEFSPGETIEVVDGYVRERDGSLELHVGDHGEVRSVEADVAFEPDADAIAGLEIGDTADLAGIVRSTDPVRTFDRDDGSEGQVRNVRVQDETGDIRVALWGEKADVDVGPGDGILALDVEIEDGWQDDREGSANWASTVVVRDEPVNVDLDASDVETGGDGGRGGASTGSSSTGGSGGRDDGTTGLDDFADASGSDGAAEANAGDTSDETSAADPESETDTDGASDRAAAAAVAGPDGEDVVEVTGTVVQTGDPVVLDDGERTTTVETDESVTLGQEVTVRGERRGDRIDAEDVF